MILITITTLFIECKWSNMNKIKHTINDPLASFLFIESKLSNVNQEQFCYL